MVNFNIIKAKLVEPINQVLVKHNCVLFDINNTHEFGQDILQVLIENRDRSDMDFDKLTVVSNELNEVIDQLIDINDQYALEITTPGAERPIRNFAELQEATGKYINIQFMKPVLQQTEVNGELLAVDSANQSFVIKFFIKGVKKEVTEQYSNIKQARYAIKF